MAVTEISQVGSLSKWTELTQNKELFAKVLAYAKKSYQMEIVEFLTSMKAGSKNQLTYDKYIKKGTKKEINISSKLAKKFHDVAAVKPKPDWSKAPWNDATEELLKLFRNNFGSLDP